MLPCAPGSGQALPSQEITLCLKSSATRPLEPSWLITSPVSPFLSLPGSEGASASWARRGQGLVRRGAGADSPSVCRRQGWQSCGPRNLQGGLEEALLAVSVPSKPAKNRR